jgi:hypothetical protein
MGRVPSFVAALVLLIFGTLPASAADGVVDRAGHSKAFPILTSTYITLNAIDVYTTTAAIRSGAGVESNPLVGSAASNPVAMTALKAASTTTTIVLARQLWKKHPAAAIIVLVGANAGMSFVVMHNTAVMRR